MTKPRTPEPIDRTMATSLDSFEVLVKAHIEKPDEPTNSMSEKIRLNPAFEWSLAAIIMLFCFRVSRCLSTTACFFERNSSTNWFTESRFPLQLTLEIFVIRYDQGYSGWDGSLNTSIFSKLTSIILQGSTRALRKNKVSGLMVWDWTNEDKLSKTRNTKNDFIRVIFCSRKVRIFTWTGKPMIWKNRLIFIQRNLDVGFHPLRKTKPLNI